jgi:hypothetical protein
MFQEGFKTLNLVKFVPLKCPLHVKTKFLVLVKAD